MSEKRQQRAMVSQKTFVCAFLISACSFSCSLGRAAAAERQVVFPKSPQPVGTAITHPLNNESPLNMIGPAKGIVTIKDGLALYIIATPEGMRNFDSFAALKPGDVQHLRLHDVPIAESNLKTMSKMSGLKVLDLSFSDVNDSAFKYIGELKNLTHLDLSSTNVRGMTLNQLKGLKKLIRLDISNTRTHDFAINSIVECCPNLERLNLLATYISDGSILKLQNLKHLQKLNLSKTAVTEKNLDKLLALKNLRKVTLSRNQISPKKLAELRAAKRDCSFVFKETSD